MRGNIGYCAVTADILHHGHIRFIEKCKSLCECLIVGVMTDKCVKKYKGEYPIMTYKERVAVVAALRDAHNVIPQDTFEFPVNELREKYGVDTIFDSVDHQRDGADMYFKYDTSINSSEIKKRIINRKGKKC